MAGAKIEQGNILSMGQKEYMMLDVQQEDITVIERGISRLSIFKIPSSEVINGYLTGEMTVKEADPVTYDRSLMSEKEKGRFEKYCNLMCRIDDLYGPSYLPLSRKRGHKELLSLCKEFQITTKTAWKYIRLYLQSGRNIYSLVDMRYHASPVEKPYVYKKKPGRKHHDDVQQGVILDDRIRKIYDEVLGYWKKHPYLSVKMLFKYMDMKYFTFVGQQEAITKRPTFRQFQYYFYKHTTPTELEARRQGYRKYINNSRPLKGDTIVDTLGPGHILEMDEQEMPVYIVSDYDNEKTVGKPVLYWMVDTYSRAIVAFSIGWENNSFIGATNCLANLACDKEQFCKHYDMPYEADKWPSNFKPQAIRCDRGSEYMGRNLNQVFAEQDIQLLPLPGGTGSYKGTVEGSFSEYLKMIGPSLRKHGLVLREHGSKHQKEACLTLDQLTKIVLKYIYYHNSKDRSRTYPATRDQISRGIEMTSSGIWEYGISRYGNVMPIVNREDFLYSMCVPLKKVKVTDKGLYIPGAVLRSGGSADKGLYYICDEDNELNEWRKRCRKRIAEFDLECRIDERDIGKMYYLRNGRMYIARLTPYINGNLDYDHCSLFQYQKEQLYRERIARKTKEKAEQLEYRTISDINMIINNASRSVYSDNSDLRNTLHREKAMRRGRHSLEETVEGFSPFMEETPESTVEDRPVFTDETVIDIDEEGFSYY